MPLNFAANLSFMFTEHPFEERFAAAADAGFRGVEFLFPYAHAPRDIAHWVKDAGLTLALHNLPPGDWGAGARGLAALPDRAAEMRASVETALRYAEATGLRQMHVMAGIAEPTMDARDCYAKTLAYVCTRFAEYGITALIEPINTRDMPGYFLRDFDLAEGVMADVSAPNLKLQFDCYHAEIITGDAVGALRRHMPDIAHVQIASVPDRHEPDHGTCEYRRIFRELEAQRYTGWIGCEYHPAAGTEAGLGWLRSQSG